MKKIEFIPAFDFVENIGIDPPVSSIKHIPDWYKTTSTYIDGNKFSRSKINPLIKSSNLSVKACMPFFDAMTSGYTIVLPADILVVDSNEYGHRILWDAPFKLVEEHIFDQVKSIPSPYKEYDVFKWTFNFIIKTPKDYSCNFSHPKFIYSLPFTTLDGIVDTDTYNIPINFPFFLNKNFKGKILKGTPICQFFPFKRESWKAKNKNFSEKNLYNSTKFFLAMEKVYKNNFWNRKEYK